MKTENYNRDIDNLRKLIYMFLSLSYATQEAFRSNHPIEIQKAEGFRARRSNGKSVTTTPPQSLMTVDVQALSATISLAVTQAVEQALGQVNKTPAPVATEKELVDAGYRIKFPCSPKVRPPSSQHSRSLAI